MGKKLIEDMLHQLENEKVVESPFIHAKVHVREGQKRATEIIQKKGVAYLQYKALQEMPWLVSAFSTRMGGVSTGVFAEMNISFTVGDLPGNVEENFRILGDVIGIKPEQMVYAKQTHSTNVLQVGKEHCGMGVTGERDFDDTDGLMTNEPGVCLVTSHADCTPLYFVDPIHKAIALSHSGWRGTYGDICGVTIECMQKAYGTDLADLICCIGPCIGPECYEVGEDVADPFKEKYPEIESLGLVPTMTVDGKTAPHLDLPGINAFLMEKHGVKKENIRMPDLCTACNASWLHSHRASEGKRGGMGAFLMIRA